MIRVPESARAAHIVTAFCTALVLTSGLASAARGEGVVQVSIDSPGAGVRLEGAVHQAEIDGQALAAGDAPQQFDVMLAIDVSQSISLAVRLSRNSWGRSPR